MGWSDRVAALAASHDEPGAVPGRVVRVDRGGCLVATDLDAVALAAEGLAVGDWVLLAGPGEAAGLVAVLPRWSELARLRGERQVLAANVDLVLITAPADRLSPARVEREVVLAWDSGARPLVVLTKADLAAAAAADDLAHRVPGVDILAASAVTGEGVVDLRARLAPSATAVLFGPSGAGKSTLINALLGASHQATGDVRASDHRGRHITTRRELLPVPTGGAVIDMPGLRELALDVDVAAVAAAFEDVEELAAGCRFADCRHDVEPGCAVIAAADDGTLGVDRLASYRKLQREAALERRRRDPLSRRANERIWKLRAKAAKEISRRKER